MKYPRRIPSDSSSLASKYTKNVSTKPRDGTNREKQQDNDHFC